ncbi:hypothetical protein KBD61_02110 [Patescibacteria group bacterium]|nr:hypothetical protein [Patescibacteria group bacterium]MBP9709803.1 hypothetical protein [Patescibacteria group bacterium]
MPDGNGPAKAPQQEAGREGIIVRASAKLEEFRQKIKALFAKEGSDKIDKKDTSRIDKILAIARDDVARVKKEGAPLEMILEEAKAGLAGVTLEEDLNGAVEGLKKKQREAVENALKEYREALVEVLKEGEASGVKSEERVPAAATDAGAALGDAAKSQAEPASGVEAQPTVQRATVAPKEKRPPRTKNEDDTSGVPWIDDFANGVVESISRDFKDDEILTAEILASEKPKKHLAEYKKLVAMAMEADHQRESFSATNAEYYEKLMADIKAATKEYIALSEETPVSIDSTPSTPVPGERVEGGLSDEELIEAVMDAPNPKREDLVGPFQRMMLLATRADALSRRVKTDESQRAEYVQKLRELRTAREMYQVLERAEPPVGGQVQAEEEEEAQPVAPSGAPVADIADLAGMLRRSSNSKREPQRPDASLSEGTDKGPINVPADVAERLKIETEARAEARAEKESKDVIRLIEGLRADRRRETMALAALFKGSEENQAAFEALMEEDLRVHVARWLVDFMDGQYEMVRLPANEAWKEVTDAKGNVMQVMEANESDKDEYKKTAVAESTYALAAVVKAGANFGFTDEKEIRALALEPLPSEQKGGLGSFVMDAGKALGKERQRGELQAAAREIGSINERLSKHALKLAPLGEDEVQALQVRRDELLATRKRLMEELTGNRLGNKVESGSSTPSTENVTPIQEELQAGEARLVKAKEGLQAWKDITEVDGDIQAWVAWFDGLITAQKDLASATLSERDAAILGLEKQIAERPSSGHANSIAGWIEKERGIADRLETDLVQRGSSDEANAEAKAKRAYIDEVVDPRSDVFQLVRGYKVDKLKSLLDAEKEKATPTDSAVIEVNDDELEAAPLEEADHGEYLGGTVEGRPRKRDKNADGSQAKSGTGNAPDIFDATDFSVEETKSAYEDTGSSAAPINPDATPPVPPVETSRIGIDTAELKTRTEAARAMIDSVNTGIAAWGKDRRDGVGQEYYIKDAVAYLERIIKRDEVFLALATPTEDDERAYSEERKAMLEGDLKRQYDRLFVLALKGSKKPYAEEFPAWITNAKKRAEVAGAKGDQDGRKREEVYAKEIEKRKEVIDAIRPFFEVWLKMETKEATVPVPDATAAPTPTPDTSAAPKPPEATPAAADASSPVPPEAAPATPPAVPKTPDASAAPVPPSAPPAAPPTPDKKAKAPVRPEPKFANAALFEGEDGKELLAWLKTHGPLVDDAKKVLDDEEQEKVLAQYAPFAEHATLLDNIVEVTTQLTQAKTPAERVISEARLVGLRQKAPGSIRAQATLDDLQAEKRAIKAEMEDDEDEPRAGVGREKREKNKARLAEIKALMSLVDKDVELERALMEVATMEGERDINKIKNTLDETEDREADAGKAWKDVMDEAKEAHDTLSENMQARSKPPGSEKYFGSLFEAFAKDQERAIEFNKVLRTFNVLDSAEVHITQTLRVLDREGSGPLAPGVWDEMPISVQEYLDKAGESDKSTIEGIKAKLYERLRAITRAKVEADRELQAHMQEIDTLEEKSSYALAQEVHAKLQEEDRQLLRQLSGLRAEIEMYNPAKAGKPQDKTFYTAKVEELTARLELTRNEQWHTNMLLKDSAALLEVAGRAPLRKSGSIGEVEASAIDALKSQKDITAALVKVMNGQEALAERKQELAARETELRASLPSAPSAQGGGASFGKGTPAPENRTSGGGGEKEKSMWESFMETGLGKSGKEFVEAFKFWQ